MDSPTHIAQFDKDKAYLRAFCQGRQYIHALKALGFLERTTSGKLRKDGKMPEAHHMIRLALNATQLQLSPKVATNGLADEEHLITALLLHDCLEDDVSNMLDEHQIASLTNTAIARTVWRMTKKFRGQKKDPQVYVKELLEDPMSTLGKGLDRNDNLEHMLGVFGLEKVKSYSQDAATVFVPMLKEASKLYPEHLAAFQSVRYRMKRNLVFLSQHLELWQKYEDLTATAS